MGVQGAAVDLVAVPPNTTQKIMAALRPAGSLGKIQEKLFRAEGLGQIIIRPGLQSLDAIFRLGPRREHDDGCFGRAAVPPELLEDPVTIPAGKHQVEDHQVGRFLQGHLETRNPVMGNQGLVSRPIQVEGDQFRHIRLVFNNQYSVNEMKPVYRRSGRESGQFL